ncbi:CsbD family protein [Euzebyella marina]|uniref:CsbD family protein n=1 Tax=Euzebyella marina TaxID=1761453 RepID=A0A3G2L5N5_9FLAO|nr:MULTISPECIES: CsbD family protein [Bacteroidota]AYN67516.1 CsbD family protein [Euzebyella marina]MAU70576.1 CsbD family protein [Pseudozobellia sp.]MBC7000482.1 CsbD family protein [Cytophaga sp. FL35]MBG48064.1 CsbD family protein [Pseudozobellia sp.]|tara:strand:- start:63 stop:263 length:201 start_codon:yes stop_codon:yes gene_type:complete
MSAPWKDKVKGNWNIAKGKIKQEWGELTDDDLDYQEGKEDELIGRIQKRTGESKERVNDFLDNLKY